MSEHKGKGDSTKCVNEKKKGGSYFRTGQNLHKLQSTSFMNVQTSRIGPKNKKVSGGVKAAVANARGEIASKHLLTEQSVVQHRGF